MAATILLKDLCTMDITDGTHKTPTYVDEGYIFLSSKNVTSGVIDWDNVMYIPESLHNELYKRIAPRKNDILLAKNGTTGVAAIVDRDEVFDIYVSLALLRPDETKVLPRYLLHAINSYPTKQFFDSHLKGIGVPNLHLTHIRETPIKIPSFVEQQHITYVLDKVAELIALRKEQLVKLDQLVKSRFIELFGDMILNPFGWEKDSLGAVCDVRDGTHDSPQYYEIGYPLVTSKNVTGGKIDLTGCSLICEADFKKINERSKVDIGDIIMPMIGTVGKPVIVDIEPIFAIKNVALIKFKANSKVLNIYIRALLQSDYFDDAVLSKVRGGTQKFISLGDIRKLPVLVPPMGLQEQFAAFVEQTDKSKLAIQQSLDKLELLKKSLMQEYFG